MLMDAFLFLIGYKRALYYFEGYEILYGKTYAGELENLSKVKGENCLYILEEANRKTIFFNGKRGELSRLDFTESSVLLLKDINSEQRQTIEQIQNVVSK